MTERVKDDWTVLRGVSEQKGSTTCFLWLGGKNQGAEWELEGPCCVSELCSSSSWAGLLTHTANWCRWSKGTQQHNNRRQTNVDKDEFKQDMWGVVRLLCSTQGQDSVVVRVFDSLVKGCWFNVCSLPVDILEQDALNLYLILHDIPICWMLKWCCFGSMQDTLSK